MSASDKDSAGDLLIQEVDEELRREQYHKLWKRYGNHIIAGAGAIVLIVAGYQFYQDWQARQRQHEANQYAQAEKLIADGKTADAGSSLAKLQADGNTGFALAAGMRRADLLAGQGDMAGAKATYDQIANGNGPTLYRDLALIKLALLTVDSGDAASLEGRLTPLAEISNPWHFSATEVLALIARKKGDTARAVTLYKQLADDLQAPPGIRARAAEMLAVLTPGAEKAKG